MLICQATVMAVFYSTITTTRHLVQCVLDNNTYLVFIFVLTFYLSLPLDRSYNILLCNVSQFPLEYYIVLYSACLRVNQNPYMSPAQMGGTFSLFVPPHMGQGKKHTNTKYQSIL